MKTTRLYQTLRLLLLISAVSFILISAKFAIVHLYPFLIALILALILNPFASLLERRMRLPRSLAVITILGLFFMLLTGIMIVIIAEIAQGATVLSETLPSQMIQLADAMNRLAQDLFSGPYDKLRTIIHSLGGTEQALVHYQFNGLLKQAADALQRLLWQLPQWLLIIPSSLATILLSFLAAFFIANDWPRITRFCKQSVPEKADKRFKRFLTELKKTIGNYAKAQLVLLAATGLIVFIGLLILKVENAFTLSLITIGVDLLPYAGTGLVFIPWIIYVFLAGQYNMAIGLCILYMVIILFRQLAEPKLLSSSIGVHPLIMLISLFAGLKIWGPAGLLAVPVLLVLLNGLRASGLLSEAWLYIKNGKI